MKADKTPKETPKSPAAVDDVLRRMLSMPPEPHKPKKAMSKPKPKATKKKPA
jgi:hypothetical protein